MLELAKLNLDGIAAMRSGGSVLKAPSAAEGALPREHRPRAGHTELNLDGVAGHAERGLRPQGAQRRRGGTPPRAGTG